jgi:uncharacterized protein
MSLETAIMDQMKTAMKSKDTIALESLRAIKSALLLAKTETGKATEITEEQEIAILQRLVKQRKDAAEQFSAQNRTELAEKEMAQASVILSFLPKQLSEEQIKAEIIKIMAETGAESGKELGKVMGVASKKLAGKADGKMISEIAKSLLN